MAKWVKGLLSSEPKQNSGLAFRVKPVLQATVSWRVDCARFWCHSVCSWGMICRCLTGGDERGIEVAHVQLIQVIYKKVGHVMVQYCTDQL